MKKKHRRLKRLLTVTTVIISAPMIIVAACGRSLLYHPTNADVSALVHHSWRAERLEVEKGVEVVGLTRPSDDPNAPWLLFFGGNAMSLESTQWALDNVAGTRPWGLTAFAYRGYDGSGGAPSEAALTADAEAITAYLQETYQVAPERLVIIGQSLGTGVASHLAASLSRAETPPRGLALLSPYTSMSQVFDDQVPVIPVGWVTPDTYPTIKRASELSCPIVLIHGDADTLIGIEHSQQLHDVLGDRADFITLEGRGHNDLWADPRTSAAIRALTQR